MDRHTSLAVNFCIDQECKYLKLKKGKPIVYTKHQANYGYGPNYLSTDMIIVVTMLNHN